MTAKSENVTPLLDDIRMLEIGGRAAAVCGLLFAQLGADVITVGLRPDSGEEWSPFEAIALKANKRHHPLDLRGSSGLKPFQALLAEADLVVVDASPREIEGLGLSPDALMAMNAELVVATITPFGFTGPRRNFLGGDLISFHASGVARLLVGHVEEPESEPPVRAYGEQADFIAGLTAACASMHGLYQQQRTGAGQAIDVSVQEAMALMAARELAMPGFGGQPAPRRGPVRGGSATIPVLPAVDGVVAISPREAHQWRQWLGVMGNPAWGADPRFATRAQRAANYPALFDLMAEWSRTRRRADIFEACQLAHVPCFPFGSPGDMLLEQQLRHRRFFAELKAPGGDTVSVPRPPFGLPLSAYAPAAPGGETEGSWRPRPAPPQQASAPKPPTLPLAGCRVLDFSWVIAGPTCTRYLALMGAEVIKIEAPDRPDTGRVSELHDVLGESKLGFSIDLKASGAIEAVRRLLEDTDVVVENFATGVMERLGLGYEDLRRLRPDIILLSASGLGRNGPGAEWVAYGNLLSAYTGFAELNGFPGREPRTGLAWADPLCGLFMAFGVVAALRDRDRGGGGRHIDFSMLEGLLWTMPDALIRPQLSGEEARPAGNDHPAHSPHGVYRCAGDDRWLAITAGDEREWRSLCGVVPGLHGLESLSEDGRRATGSEIDRQLRLWAAERDAIEAMEMLQSAGVPAAASYTTNDLFGDAHLWDRGFYKQVQGATEARRFLPGLPWLWVGADIEARAAPGVGEHTEFVLREMAGLSQHDVERLRSAGALGRA